MGFGGRALAVRTNQQKEKRGAMPRFSMRANLLAFLYDREKR
jgi:hypothetical protein